MKNKLILAAYFQKHFLEDENSRANYLRWSQEDEDQIQRRLMALMPLSVRAVFSDQVQKSLDEGHGLLEMSDPLYPRMWKRISYAPFLFSYLGSPAWTEAYSLAVVGSREASSWSLQWMNENISPLVSQDLVHLCSGGARGVDQRAHRISLMQKKPTWIVLPSGLSKIYPPNLREDVDLVLESGGVFISEYASDQEIRRHHFQARNRLICGLSLATLVVQAERRSGTLITARQSLEQGKPLWIVPSHPLDQRARGGLDLLLEGASPIVGAQELEAFVRSELKIWLWSDTQVLLAQESKPTGHH